MSKPFIRIDDIELEIEKSGNHFDVEFKLEADSAFQIYGPTMESEYDSTVLKHEIIGALRDSMGSVLPRILEDEGFNRSVRRTLFNALTSEPYLMAVLGMFPKRKVGPPALFPPNGAFLDIDLRIADEIQFYLIDGKNVRFIFDESHISTPRRLSLAETKQAEYGYLPGKQSKQGVYVNKKTCPKPKKSPKTTKTVAYCTHNAPEGHMPPIMECPGFGGFADGMVVCRYVEPMTAKKKESTRSD